MCVHMFYTHTHTHMYVCVYVYICMCVYTYTHICIYKHFLEVGNSILDMTLKAKSIKQHLDKINCTLSKDFANNEKASHW